MGTTPNAGLPYPETTKDINQGANDIKALALALDVQVKPKRIVFIDNQQWPATDSASVSRFPTGLTKIKGAVVVSTSDGNTLITVGTATTWTGGTLAVHVMVDGGAWANKSFQASAIVWGE